MTYPTEYDLVVDQVKANRMAQKYNTGKLEGDHAIQRALHEIPEKLQIILIKNLDVDQTEYFKSKEGARWFATRFPQFSLAEKV